MISRRWIIMMRSVISQHYQFVQGLHHLIIFYKKTILFTNKSLKLWTRSVTTSCLCHPTNSWSRWRKKRCPIILRYSQYKRYQDQPLTQFCWTNKMMIVNLLSMILLKLVSRNLIRPNEMWKSYIKISNQVQNCQEVKRKWKWSLKLKLGGRRFLKTSIRLVWLWIKQTTVRFMAFWINLKLRMKRGK